MTIEMDAEPHPSLVCATNGTSIQVPAVSAPRLGCKVPATIASKTKMTRAFIFSVNSDDDQNQDSDAHKDNKEVAVRNSSRGEVFLRFFRACRQLREFIVAHLRNRVFYLLGIDMGGFHRLLCRTGRKEIFDLRQILLARSRNGGDIFLKIRRRNDMILRVRARSCRSSVGSSERCLRRFGYAPKESGAGRRFPFFQCGTAGDEIRPYRSPTGKKRDSSNGLR